MLHFVHFWRYLQLCSPEASALLGCPPRWTDSLTLVGFCATAGRLCKRSGCASGWLQRRTGKINHFKFNMSPALVCKHSSIRELGCQVPLYWRPLCVFLWRCVWLCVCSISCLSSLLPERTGLFVVLKWAGLFVAHPNRRGSFGENKDMLWLLFHRFFLEVFPFFWHKNRYNKRRIGRLIRELHFLLSIQGVSRTSRKASTRKCCFRPQSDQLHSGLSKLFCDFFGSAVQEESKGDAVIRRNS